MIKSAHMLRETKKNLFWFQFNSERIEMRWSAHMVGEDEEKDWVVAWYFQIVNKYYAKLFVGYINFCCVMNSSQWIIH